MPKTIRHNCKKCGKKMKIVYIRRNKPAGRLKLGEYCEECKIFYPYECQVDYSHLINKLLEDLRKKEPVF